MTNGYRKRDVAKPTTTARRARAEHKKQGDPEGESGSPFGLLVSRCEVPLCGGYAARTDLPRSLAMA